MVSLTTVVSVWSPEPITFLNGVLGSPANACMKWLSAKQMATTYDVLMELLKGSQGVLGAHFEKCCYTHFSRLEYY